MDTEDTNITEIYQPLSQDISTSNHKINLNGSNGILTYKVLDPANPNTAQIGFIRDYTTTVGLTTETILFLLPDKDNTTFTFQVLVSGFSNNNYGIGGYTTASFKIVAGVVSLLDEPDIIMQSDIELNGAYFNIEASGGQININVTGIIDETIKWSVCIPGLIQSL